MNPQNQDTPVDEQFLKEMGLADLPEEEKPEALANILQALNMRVAMRVADTLSEEQMAEFDQLTEGDPSEESVADWLKSRVPNYNELINEEAENMRREALDMVNKVMGQPGGQSAV